MANLPARHARAVHDLEPMRLDLEKAFVAGQFLGGQSSRRQRQSLRCVTLDLFGQARHAAQFYRTAPPPATCIVDLWRLSNAVFRSHLHSNSGTTRKTGLSLTLTLSPRERGKPATNSRRSAAPGCK